MKATAVEHPVNNLKCARLILEDPLRHGGPDSLICRWARLVVAGTQSPSRGPVVRKAGNRA